MFIRQFPRDNLERSLLARWGFDDVVPWVDDTGTIKSNTINGTPRLANGIAIPSHWNQQRGGLTFVLASDNYIDLARPASLNLTGAVSLSAWVNLASLPNATNTAYYIVSSATTATLATQFFMAFGFTTPNVNIQFSAQQGNISSVQTFSLNRWYHIAGSSDTANDFLYINGVQVATAASAASSGNVTTGGVTIGDYNSGTLFNNGPLDGTLDDVRIYNRGLSAAEVWQLYTQAFQPDYDVTRTLMRAPIAGGFTAKFRRTLSPMGTHVGGRQRQGWVA